MMEDASEKGLNKLYQFFTMLHEGVFESFKRIGKDVNFKLECTFLASKVDKNHRYVFGVLKDCSDLFFHTWEDEHDIYLDLDEIARLDMEILNAEIDENDFLKLYVNCSNTFTGGNLLLKAKDLLLYNEDLIELTVDTINDVLENQSYN